MATVIFDMDGVLFRGTETLPHAAECIGILRESNAKIGFLTNNSTRARGNYIDLLAGHGIQVEENEIMTSGEATARHLADEGHSGKRVLVIGGEGLSETLLHYGFETESENEGNPCEFVIVGWSRNITFEQIVRAQHEIIINSASLIATNADPMFPAKGGRLLPGAGAMVAAIETASGVKAKLIGKPNTISIAYLLFNLGESSSSPLGSIWVVGDRLDTDIACGNSLGARTVLVTTGITNRVEGEHASGVQKPEFIIDSLSELPELVTGE